MRVLVTGGAGFVGSRLVRRLAAQGRVEVHGLVRGGVPAELADLAVTWHRADLAEATRVREVVAAVAAERLFHLAAVADPRACSASPRLAWRVNARGTLAVLAGFFAGRRDGRALVVSTAQVYGRRTGILRESDRPDPVTVYGRSKLAAERIARGCARRGCRVVVARAFNHTGRGQSTAFVVPAIAASLARAVADGTPLRHGNLFPRRDFLHVEDVLDAYELLIARGEPGAVYNVCRGASVAVGELLAGLVARIGSPVSMGLDPALARADDPEELVGDPQRLQSLGWSPRWSIDAMLDDIAEPPRNARTQA